jgi:hypothetical protein
VHKNLSSWYSQEKKPFARAAKVQVWRKNGLSLQGQVAKMESVIVKQICHLAILTVAKYHQIYEDNKMRFINTL